MIRFYPVDSTQMTAMGYVAPQGCGEETGVLVVQFQGGKFYRYENVEPETVIAILFGESVGKAFNSYIRSKPTTYPYSEITSEQAFAL